MAINEMPPMLSGSVTQNIANLRAYLVRMVNELNDVAAAASDGTAITAAPSVQKAMMAASKDKTAEDIRKNAESLKSLIVKTANELAEKLHRATALLCTMLTSALTHLARYMWRSLSSARFRRIYRRR